MRSSSLFLLFVVVTLAVICALHQADASPYMTLLRVGKRRTLHQHNTIDSAEQQHADDDLDDFHGYYLADGQFKLPRKAFHESRFTK